MRDLLIALVDAWQAYLWVLEQRREKEWEAKQRLAHLRWAFYRHHVERGAGVDLDHYPGPMP